MFFKLSVIVTPVLITLAAATNPPTTPQNSPQCCFRVVSSTDSNATAVAALVGIDLTDLNVPIGLSCRASVLLAPPLKRNGVASSPSTASP
ncbi:hypothetical protein C8J57DRAFT_1319189, partial [Mycena rebaudengoi]